MAFSRERFSCFISSLLNSTLVSKDLAGKKLNIQSNFEWRSSNIKVPAALGFGLESWPDLFWKKTKSKN